MKILKKTFINIFRVKKNYKIKSIVYHSFGNLIYCLKIVLKYYRKLFSCILLVFILCFQCLNDDVKFSRYVILEFFSTLV